MKQILNLNQFKAVEWDLTISESFVFGYCYELEATQSNQVSVNGGLWSNVNKEDVASLLPMISDKPDTIYRHYKTLQSKGLIQWISIQGCDYARLTEKGKTWGVTPDNF